MRIARSLLATLALCCVSSVASASQVPIGFKGNHDIQTQLIKEFPVGAIHTLVDYLVSFRIPTSNNLWDSPGNLPLKIHASVPNVKTVYMLMNAYAPQPGNVIAKVEFRGSSGGDAIFSLTAGQDIRDFCVSTWANTTTASTTRMEFEVANVVDACGTGNVNTGLMTTYHIDELAFPLPTAFQSRSLTQIIITPTNPKMGVPILLGLTAEN